MPAQEACDGAIRRQIITIAIAVTIIKQCREHQKDGGLHSLGHSLFRPSVLGPLEIVDHNLLGLLHLHLKIRLSVIKVDEKMVFGLCLGD
jgi:hypothetical protein